MSLPRNRVAYERAQAVRAEIRALLERHSPTAERLTAKRLLAMLSCPLSERAIQRHVRAIQQDSCRLPPCIDTPL
jgi:hypothetical protein